MKNEPCKLAFEILSKTSDGDDLAPEQLKLLELAVNGHLNDLGKQMFRELHAIVTEGKYAKPWLHGVEHLTQDHEGYVYWKGHHVEHWNDDMSRSKRGEVEAIELARRCKIIEASEETLSPSSVVWNWQEPDSDQQH